jgi:hypothetical protein
MLPGSPRAPFAFKDSMIHKDLQFTLGIAVRCVLHRCTSQEIHRCKLFWSSFWMIKGLDVGCGCYGLWLLWLFVRDHTLHTSRITGREARRCREFLVLESCGNDPSAGSPTETLLRLLLPLNDQVWATSRHTQTKARVLQSIDLTKPFNR